MGLDALALGKGGYMTNDKSTDSKIKDVRPLDKRGRNAFQNVEEDDDDGLSTSMTEILLAPGEIGPVTADKVWRPDVIYEFDKLPPTTGTISGMDGSGTYAGLPPGASGNNPQIGTVILPRSVPPQAGSPTISAGTMSGVIFDTIKKKGGFIKNMPKPAVVALLDHEMAREDRATAVMVRPFVYYSPTGNKIRVPIGYVTDFASIPWMFRFLIAPFGRHARAAIVHDWLYAVGQKGQRAFADRAAFDALKDLGVDPVRQWVIYIGVRLGGWMGYGKKSEWQKSWANWRSGLPKEPPCDREQFYDFKWPPGKNL